MRMVSLCFYFILHALTFYESSSTIAPVLCLDYGQNERNGGDAGIPLISGPRAFHVDDETMAILTGERKLIAREYLKIGDVVDVNFIQGHIQFVFA